MTDWKSIGRKLAGAGLPIIGAQLGGPVGAAVGRDIAARIGVEPDPEIVAQALGDPETMLELRRMEIDAAAAERTDALRAQEIAAQDVQHAREHAPDDGVRRWLAKRMPVVAVLFGAGMVAVLVWKDQITEAMTIGGMVLGWLIRDSSSFTQFYSGSSLGSAKRAQEMAAMTEQRR